MIGKAFMGLAEVRVEELRHTQDFHLTLKPWEGKPNAGASRVQGTLDVRIEYFSAMYDDLMKQQAELAHERESGGGDGISHSDYQHHLQQQQHQQQPVHAARGLEQKNLKGWTALLGAAHYGQLYVVHYLVSKGASPDTPAHSGHTARDMPMSLLAHNRFGVPVVQPQILAAIEEGTKDRSKVQRNVKRHAVEKALIRFKRAERYMIDASRARHHGQFEVAHLLHSYAVQETRPVKLIREEIEIRAHAQQAQAQMMAHQRNLLAYRQGFVVDLLQKEARRNFLLAERYIEDKAVSRGKRTRADPGEGERERAGGSGMCGVVLSLSDPLTRDFSFSCLSLCLSFFRPPVPSGHAVSVGLPPVRADELDLPRARGIRQGAAECEESNGSRRRHCDGCFDERLGQSHRGSEWLGEFDRLFPRRAPTERAPEEGGGRRQREGAAELPAVRILLVLNVEPRVRVRRMLPRMPLQLDRDRELLTFAMHAHTIVYMIQTATRAPTAADQARSSLHASTARMHL